MGLREAGLQLGRGDTSWPWDLIPALGPHPSLGASKQSQGSLGHNSLQTRSLHPHEAGAWGCRPWWALTDRGFPLGAEGFELQEANKRVLPLVEVMGLAAPKGALGGCWTESLC